VTIKMRTALRAFLKSFLAGENAPQAPPHPQPFSPRGRGETDRWAVWKALKASRRQPDFMHSTWAAEFGFASYTRFYRACMVTHGKTPHQLEMEIIDDLLKERDGEESPDRRAQPAFTLDEIEAKIQQLRPLDWMAAPWERFEDEAKQQGLGSRA
jgi:hypothetical protein